MNVKELLDQQQHLHYMRWRILIVSSKDLHTFSAALAVLYNGLSVHPWSEDEGYKRKL
jgi:hypothetical protein